MEQRLKSKQTIGATPFLLDETSRNQPSQFEVEFYFEGKYYAYGLKILGFEILEEWLYEVHPRKKQQELIFQRRSTGRGISIDIPSQAQLEQEQQLLLKVYEEELLDPFTPFVWVVRDKDFVPGVKQTFQWFSERLVVIFPEAKYIPLVPRMVQESRFRKLVNRILPTLDTGVLDLEIQKLPAEDYFGENESDVVKRLKSKLQNEEGGVLYDAGKEWVYLTQDEQDQVVAHRLVARHAGGKVLEFFRESDGTRRILELLPAYEILLNRESVVFVDEIGRSLHPSLLRAFLEHFLNTSSKGQLVFTTHESQLLDLKLFRQDEIWFIEKTQEGSSRLYSLSEFKPRYDLDIRRGYLLGRFGAVPDLWEFQNLSLDYGSEKQKLQAR